MYFGTSTFAIPPLRALVTHGYPVVAVVTQPDRPAGRGGQLRPPPVKEAAEELGLPIWQPESCRTPEFLAQVRVGNPELIVVAAYGQFLPDALLALPVHGSVNLHGSLLPRWRGAAPIQRALLQGDTETGVCLMWMVRAMDAGDVIACEAIPIQPEDTAGTLMERLAVLAATLLLRWLPALACDEAPRLAQNPAQVTFAPPIRKEERDIDWTQPAEAIWRHIRALAPTPGATTQWRGQPVKVLAAMPVEGPAGIPGTIVEGKHTALLVATGAGTLRIDMLQPAGKRPMSGTEFLRGSHATRGERFGG